MTATEPRWGFWEDGAWHEVPKAPPPAPDEARRAEIRRGVG
jgi:hypothetical protein